MYDPKKENYLYVGGSWQYYLFHRKVVIITKGLYFFTMKRILKILRIELQTSVLLDTTLLNEGG